MTLGSIFFLIKTILFVTSCLALSISWPFILILSKNSESNKVYGRFMHYLFKNAIFAKLKYLNSENIEKDKNYIYICNHQSFFDIAIIGLIYPNNCYIIAKNSLKYVPYFGQLYLLAGNFYIKRNNSEEARKTIKEIVRNIKTKKNSIFIFPQGTRAKDNKVTKLKRGFLELAKSTETDILPLVISSYQLKDILLNFRNKKTIYLKVCDKISFKKPDDIILEEVKMAMTKTINELDTLS